MCGGGVAALENEIGRVDRLCCEVVWSAEDGRSNVRDIRACLEEGRVCAFLLVFFGDAHRALVRLRAYSTRAPSAATPSHASLSSWVVARKCPMGCLDGVDGDVGGREF